MKIKTLLFFTLSLSIMAQSVPLLRISVENTENHVQTIAIQEFINNLENELGDRINIELYHSAQLYRDRDVIRAVTQGKVEMAVPGTWQFGQYIDDVELFLLPQFYGKESAFTYDTMDTEVGDFIIEEIELLLNVSVLGRWLDLGFAHIFTTQKQITSADDFLDAKIRVAGGVANKLRIEAFGGEGVIIAWPDLPTFLTLNQIDGVLTTYESVRSAKLWEKGIAYVYEDKEYFPQYIPIISERFWRRLPLDIRETIVEQWDIIVDKQRENARNAQISAKNELLEHGITIYTPSDEELEANRQILLAEQETILKQLTITPELIEIIRELTKNGE